MIRKTLLVISLVLLVCTVALWVRSHRWRDQLRVASGTLRVNVTSLAGQVVVHVRSDRRAPSVPFSTELVVLDASRAKWKDNTRGVRLLTSQGGFGRNVYVQSANWIPTMLFAALPGWALVKRFRRLRRRHHNLCVTCGYDLRGSVSTVCPECGTAFEPNDRGAIHKHANESSGSRTQATKQTRA